MKIRASYTKGDSVKAVDSISEIVLIN